MAVHKQTNKQYALKLFSKSGLKQDQMKLNNLYHEINVMQRVCHDNLMNVYEILEDNNNFYFVCEFVQGGDLDNLINKLNDEHQEKLSE